MQKFGIKFPSKYVNARWVETVEGAFTLQAELSDPSSFTENDRKNLAVLSKQALENMTGEKVGKYVAESKAKTS